MLTVDADSWIQRKPAKQKVGIGGPGLTGLGVQADDRYHHGVFARSHKSGAKIGFE